MEPEYLDTSGALARAAGTTVPTITAYAKAGWLDFIVSSNGVRLYRRGQADNVRKILAERMARRGRKSA